ncbi:MAG: [protein-PII] uridylyltransferase [Candidatus Symbiobacter sp.]|nr:[protein-PII] uridylyltransferase [Candidatus Symbiobacter sp.]
MEHLNLGTPASERGKERIPHPRVIIHRRAVEQSLAELSPELAASERRRLLLGWLKQAYSAGSAEIRRRFDAVHAAKPRSDVLSEYKMAGQNAAAGTAYLIDQILRIIYDEASLHLYPAANPTAQDRMALIAVGGYGRGEMAPFSDIDLMFLLPWKATPHCEQIIEHMIYMLWDMGLKLGHAVRGIDQCLHLARGDGTIRSALLDARYVWGDEQIYDDFRRQLAQMLQEEGKNFAYDKLTERSRRHEKMDDSRYVLEPNIKEGKGGLRDVQTLIWVSRFAWQINQARDLADHGILTASEARRLSTAHEFLWKLRFHLHYLAGRGDERLSFELQPELARRLHFKDRPGGKGVERFMKYFFLVVRWVGEIGRMIEANLPQGQNQADIKALPSPPPRSPPPSTAGTIPGTTPGSTLGEVFARIKLRRRPVSAPDLTPYHLRELGLKRDQEQWRIDDATKFAAAAVNILRIFYVAGENGDSIHPTAMRVLHRMVRDLPPAAMTAWRNDPAANQIFVQTLVLRRAPDKILRLMNDAGVLGKFIPDFARIVAQMQYDRYHVFTVDEHSIYAIGILSRIEQGELAAELPLATSIMRQVTLREALYVAVFLHDIAKGRQGDHSLLGEAVAMELGPRFGLLPEETETVAWLVRHHLLMSNTALRRDVQDPKTVSDFVALVQSPQRLKLLLVLTVVDIRAVGPKVWNNWKASLLRQLYGAALELMTGEEYSDSTEPGPKATAMAQAVQNALVDFSAEEFRSYWELAVASPAYIVSTPFEALQRQARLIKRANAARSHPSDETAATDPHAWIDWHQDSQRGISEVTIYTEDQAGLFARLAGAFAASGATIIDARIFTLNNGMVLDNFALHSAEGVMIDRPATMNRINQRIEQALSLGLDALKIVVAEQSKTRQKSAISHITPRVLIDNKASRTHSVIEINGGDRPGLLFDVCAQLTELNLRIGAAKIATYGERVVDVFYLKDMFGLKIENPDQIDHIRQNILAVLT